MQRNYVEKMAKNMEGFLACCIVFGKDWKLSIFNIQKISEKDRNTTRVDGIRHNQIDQK